MALVFGLLLFLLLCFVLGVKEQANQNKATSMAKEEDRDRDKDRGIIILLL